MKNNPKSLNTNPDPDISVICWTFNDVKFVAESIDSILRQKIDCSFEIIIHDDCSTDGTIEIIREYGKKYPNIFNNLINKENTYTKGADITSNALKKAKGRYIALTHGDDYWVDEYKLKKQYDFMESNFGCVICYHDVEVIDESGLLIKKSKLSSKSKKDFSSDELKKGAKISTQTMFFRNVVKDYPPELAFAFGGDKFLTSILGAYGVGVYLDNVKPSAFRVHKGGINRGVEDPLFAKINYLRTRIALYRYYERIGDSELRDYYAHSIEGLFSSVSISSFMKKLFS